MIKILSKNSIKVCCQGKDCCPVVTELADGRIQITDDDGNTIIVNKNEAALISDGVKTIDEQRLILG